VGSGSNCTLSRKVLIRATEGSPVMWATRNILFILFLKGKGILENEIQTQLEEHEYNQQKLLPCYPQTLKVIVGVH
jgi:hypothetical protein